ncbi:NAD(P)-dependent oxidoreductase [Ideonella sp. A 288]|uniref:NAD-dependent epimerase/dehydratase family protein n=1 Tax=Ideonella sp. A 288 TaxID=1962181 RepID=UPI000B4A9D73|nr:NAD(P)-dependent oxidoreductase [Ideonella sp. A 288]
MKNIVVTGGSGKAGRAVVRELVEHGHRVLNVDRVPPAEPLCHFLQADLNDMGQAIDALRRAAGTVERRRGFELADAVVHLAAIPAPGLAPDATTFQNNLMSTYNVFSAATLLGVPRVVWASSETLFGLPFTRVAPAFAPITEAHPMLPENGYALAKGMAEEMARQMHRWNPGTSFLGLRISNLIEPREYPMFAGWQHDARIRQWNLWSYVDSRDVARACRLGVEADGGGAEHCIIAAADTVMARPSRDLMAECFPQVPVTRPLGEFETLQSNALAQRLIGYEPQHSWRAAT